MKKFDSRDQIVLVTGASSGIGEAIAKSFASKGAKVALTGRNLQALERVKHDIISHRGVAEIFPGDLLNINSIESLIRNVEKHFDDTISILVNSAGIAILGFVEDVPLEENLNILKINFLAPLALAKAVIPSMKKKRCGQIINISSGVGKRGLPGVSPYCTSKFALNGLTESLRVELLPYNIQVISISPGLVKTKFANNIKVYGRVRERFTEGKMLTPEKIAARVIRASENKEKNVVLSLRTKLGTHLNYWLPSLLDYILKRKMEKELK